MNEPGKMNIMGESSLAGGTYSQVRVMGSLSLSGKLESRELKVMGTLDSEDDILCNVMEVMGTAKLRKLEVKDNLSVMGTVTARDVAAERVSVLGELMAEGSIECASLEVNGAVTAGNFLGADSFHIKSRYSSKVKDAGGKEIRVRGRLFGRKTVLSAETIEFDTVDIEKTEARVVRGKNVIIGTDCSIDLVEYSDTLEQHPRARIGKAVKI
ncbi:hypothetical protein K7I13_07910 [Brucepastera parasyntrophica]|uniref:hypothetical protein n=1 Tax=Brucepastera parasyntrophica TaxID=2880008 RepID=UPI0021091510|nr:hypothetical protein [Brucepastera parasyntrophica]ULQ58500.1 hypothetical protein K7I13_07910 [Brucepastera parasyntrophica]